MITQPFVKRGDCLITATAHYIGQLATRDFRQVVTILPTARLGHYLLAALAKDRGAIMPPELHTVAGFFRALDRQLPPPDERRLPALPPHAATLWLKALLGTSAKAGAATRRFRSLGPQHAGELQVFYKELIESGLWDEWFAALERYVAEECYHHVSHLDAVMARFVEVREALTTWRQHILAAGWQPQVDDEAAIAQRVAQFIRAGGLAGKTVVVAGLTSMAESWLPVFTALAEQGELCRFILPEPPPLIGQDHPMAPLLSAIWGKDQAEKVLSPSLRTSAHPPQRAAGDIVMVEAEDGIAEVDFVIHSIENLLAETPELKPAHIAVLVPSESAYSGLLTARLGALSPVDRSHGPAPRSSLATNLAIAQPLSASALGSWWLTFCTALGGGMEPLGLYHALRQPITQRLIAALWPEDPSEHGSEALSPRFWQSLYRLVTAANPLPAAVDLESLNQLVAERIPSGAKAWQRLATGYRRLLASSQSDDLLSHLSHWLTVTFERAMAKTLPPLEQSAYDALSELLTSLSHTPGLANLPMNRAELFAHIMEASQAMTIRVTGEPVAGVQILSLAEARWLPVRVAFVLGCNEGFFPRGLPSDELMTDTLKKRLGLKGWQGLEAMEDLSFSLLTARVPKVFLCRSLSFAGEDKVPSRFVEQLQGQRHHPTIQATKSQRPSTTYASSSAGEASPQPHDAQNERQAHRQTGVFAQVGFFPASWQQGDGDTPRWLSRISATAVDRLLSCPYRFALDALALDRVDTPFDDRSAIDQGIVLHRLFEQFHEGAAELDLPPLPSHYPKDGAGAALNLRFEKLVIAHLGDKATPDRVQLATVGGPRYIDHLLGLSETQGNHIVLPTGQSELLFQADPDSEALTSGGADSTIITLGGSPRRLGGQVDRLDWAAGGMVITDFKRDGVPKAAAPARGGSEKLVSAQLLLYAEGLKEQIPRERMILGYWSILKGEWTVMAVGEQIKAAAIDRGLAKKSTPSIADQWRLLEQNFSAREQQIIEEQRYRADDTACGFCTYSGVCRKGDPRHSLTTLEVSS